MTGIALPVINTPEPDALQRCGSRRSGTARQSRSGGAAARTIALCLMCAVYAWVPGAAEAQSDEDKIFRVLPRDAIPAIDEPVFEPVATAKAFNNNELMIGLVGDGDEPRAYSTGSSIGTRSSTTRSMGARSR